MDLKILDEDRLIDVLRIPQIYTIEIWVTTITITKGEHRNTGEGYDDKKKRKQLEKKFKKLQLKKIEQFFNDEDIILESSGRKPLRANFTIFNIKQISLPQIDFIRLKKLSRFAIKTNAIVEEEEEEVDEEEVEEKEEGEGEEGRQVYESPQLSESESESKESIEISKRSSALEEEIDYEKLSHLIEHNFFQPKKESTMNKSGCLTVALAPINVITEMQRGPIKIIIDRFGGRADDPGEFVGEAKISVPKEWYDTVIRVATKPLTAPAVETIDGKSPIITTKDGEIGEMEYNLIFSCYSGFVTSKIIASLDGLYASLLESQPTASSCHQPRAREDISYSSLRRSDL